ncbi:MAG: Ig-like domain-containing protein, partial [Candidatus Cryptobacteroides sp.]
SVKAAKTSVEIGEESYVTASITPATASNTTLSWEVTPDGVIEFDAQTMKFKGTAAGQVTIKATAVKDKISGSCTVTVTEPELSVSSSDNPADCFLCPDNTFSHLNRTVQLIAKMGGKAAEGITWTSSSDEIATVSQDGLVTAKGHGVCKIYAESVTQKAGITVWSASKNGYNLILTCSSPSSATPDCYEIQEGEYIVPNTTVYSSFFDPKMFMSVDGKVQNYSQLMYSYYWNGNDMDIVTASSSGSGVTITDDGNDQISFKTASSGPASGSVTFTYKPTGYSKSVNFNVGYKSVSVFKESLAQTLYKTVKSGGSITLNKSTQSNWYIYLNATETYQTNVTGGLLKSTNYDGSTKLMTCSSNSSLYVDSSGSLKISTITNGTYTLTATRDNTCTIQVTIAN